jgi:hypothetical protein
MPARLCFCILLALCWRNSIANLSIREKSGYWLADYRGAFTTPAMIELGMKLVELLKQHPSRGIVLNVRNATGELPLVGRYQIVNSMSPYWPKGTALAMVINDSQFLKLTGFIFERLAGGAGFTVSVHFDEMKARQWMIEQLHLTATDGKQSP